MALASTTVLFTEKVNDGCSSYVESSQGENPGFDWRSSEGGVETEEGVIDGKTCVITKEKCLFIGALR